MNMAVAKELGSSGGAIDEPNISDYDGKKKANKSK
jgi:hypothetical protein